MGGGTTARGLIESATSGVGDLVNGRSVEESPVNGTLINGTPVGKALRSAGGSADSSADSRPDSSADTGTGGMGGGEPMAGTPVRGTFGNATRAGGDGADGSDGQAVSAENDAVSPTVGADNDAASPTVGAEDGTASPAVGGEDDAALPTTGTDRSDSAGSKSDRDGKDAVLSGVGLGDARTALVANARVNSAAIARMLDGQSAGAGTLGEPAIQQAPPSNDHPLRRTTPAGRVGPMKLGAGQVEAHARWDAGMACGGTAGEAARSAASLNRVDLVSGADGALVRVPERISSRSTTALERHGADAETVASATVAAGRITLADGRVKVRLLRAPTLTASMSTALGGAVRYQPAVIEVSGDGVKTTRLDTVGNDIEISLSDSSRTAESTSLSALSQLDDVQPAPPLALPSIPGLPSVSAPDTESAPASEPGTKIRIALGDVRQATKGHAIAAKAATIKMSITQSAPTDSRTKDGYAGKAGVAVALNLTFGALEVAAVAPETPAVSAAGAGGGLPITGPQAGLIALGGFGLLIAGVAAVLLSMRRRRTHP